MEELKELFGDGSLSYEQFAEKVDGAKMKLVNLESGNYVAKKKYTDAQASADEYKTKYDELMAKYTEYQKEVELKSKEQIDRINQLEKLVAEYEKKLKRQ